MSSYPTLNEMGIQNPSQITEYRLTSKKETDLLRVFYERQSGSLLPTVRRYNFGRSSKLIVTDGGTNTTETVYEISPYLSKALSELDEVLKNRKKHNIDKEAVLNEIHNLETDFNAQIDQLKSMIERL